MKMNGKYTKRKIKKRNQEGKSEEFEREKIRKFEENMLENLHVTKRKNEERKMNHESTFSHLPFHI